MHYHYPAALEGLINGLGPECAPGTLKALLKENGLDADHLPALIPAHVYAANVRLAATFTWPEAREEEALRLAGLHFMRGWIRTVMGSAAGRLARLVGPERTLRRLDKSFRTTNNFQRAEVTMVAPRQARIQLKESLGIPQYYVGILQGGLEMMHLQGTVEMVASEGSGFVMVLTWTAAP